MKHVGMLTRDVLPSSELHRGASWKASLFLAQAELPTGKMLSQVCSTNTQIQGDLFIYLFFSGQGLQNQAIILV